MFIASKNCANITAFIKPCIMIFIYKCKVYLSKIRGCHLLLRLWKAWSACFNLYAYTLYLSYFLHNNWTTEVVKKWVCYFRYWLEPVFKYPSRIPGQLVMEQCYSITTQHPSQEHKAFFIAVISSFHFQLLSFYKSSCSRGSDCKCNWSYFSVRWIQW